MAKTTKGKRFSGEPMTIIASGSGCVGNMSWETPYVLLLAADGTEYIWQSEMATDAMDLPKPTRVLVWAFAYGTHLRRVSILDPRGRTYGMDNPQSRFVVYGHRAIPGFCAAGFRIHNGPGILRTSCGEFKTHKDARNWLKQFPVADPGF